MAYTRKHDYVNTSEGGPIRIGTDKYRVLRFIYDAGVQGRSYSEITKFVVEELRGRTYTRNDRGYWATNLLGTGYNASGILRDYCEKKVVRPAILDNPQAKRAYIMRTNSGGSYGLTDRENVLALEYMDAKDRYESGHGRYTGGAKGNWILADEKLEAHFGGTGDRSKSLDILRQARTNLGLPNLNF